MPSTAIDHFFYDAARHELTVTFVTGRKYVYEDVPQGIFFAFRAATSKGRFFNHHIRDRYDFREVTPRDTTHKHAS